MTYEKKLFKKIKQKIKELKQDEQGGDGLNMILSFAVTLLIIAIIFFFAFFYFNSAKNELDELWGGPTPEDRIRIVDISDYISLNISDLSTYKNFQLVPSLTLIINIIHLTNPFYFRSSFFLKSV